MILLYNLISQPSAFEPAVEALVPLLSHTNDLVRSSALAAVGTLVTQAGNTLITFMPTVGRGVLYHNIFSYSYV